MILGTTTKTQRSWRYRYMKKRIGISYKYSSTTNRKIVPLVFLLVSLWSSTQHSSKKFLLGILPKEIISKRT
jgi:hypothetical protein